MKLIRDADLGDLAAILAITNEAILHTTAIWTITPTTLAARQAWWRERTAQGFPVLVAQDGGAVIGFASFGPFRPHDGYLHTVEHSLYVGAGARRQGAGGMLLAALLARGAALGKHAMVGGIDGDNQASIALHRRFGFEACGRMPEVGRKFGRWLDLLWVQKVL